jgi:polysaccharide deacetylase 2 family uncharacterized protein YibQ
VSRRRTQPAPNFGGKGKGKSKAAGFGKATAPRAAAVLTAHDGLPGWLWALAFGLVLGAAGMAWVDRSGWLKSGKPSPAAPAVLLTRPSDNPPHPAPPDELEVVPPLTNASPHAPQSHAPVPRASGPYKATPSPLASARLVPSLSAKTRVAIVMDDAGLRVEPVHNLGALQVKLTLAVIPHLPESRAVAEYWHGLGREVILHLPMEANDNLAHDPGEGALHSGMNDEAVRDALAGDINAVPYISGINNHMGSRATSDSRLMGVLMEALKPSGLYFLDSRTAASSVAYETARAHGIRSAWRNGTFLDNERSEDAISAALHTLLAQARAQGGAVGIGHVTSPETIAVLNRELPALQGQYEFVYASEMTR